MRRIVINDPRIAVGEDRAEGRTVLIEKIDGVLRQGQGCRMRLFMRMQREAIDATGSGGKASGELGELPTPTCRIACARHEHRLQDHLDAGLVWVVSWWLQSRAPGTWVTPGWAWWPQNAWAVV